MMQIQTPPASFDWLRFNQPAVRDLAFALACPPLLASWPTGLTPSLPIDLPDASFWQAHYQRYLPRLLDLDQDPAPLTAYLERMPSTRLGLRFEGLLGFWLLDQSGPWHEYDVLGQNIQLKDAKRTIGEMDLILRNHASGQIEHWELSLKFYLGENHFEPFDWRGLNDRDTFGRKIRHTILHQFHDESSVLARNHPAVDLRRAIFKGRLFYPDRATTLDDHLPAMIDTYTQHALAETQHWLHPDHLRGTWGYDLPQQLSPTHPSSLCWRRALRREWLTPEPDLDADDFPSILYRTHGLYLGYEASDHALQAPLARMIRLPYARIPYRAGFQIRI